MLSSNVDIDMDIDTNKYTIIIINNYIHNIWGNIWTIYGYHTYIANIQGSLTRNILDNVWIVCGHYIELYAR